MALVISGLGQKQVGGSFATRLVSAPACMTTLSRP